MLGFLFALAGVVVGAQASELGEPTQSVASPPEQAVQDWSLGRLPDEGGLAAFTDYDNGIAIAFQCSAGVLSASIAGLPPAEGMRRTLRVGIDGEAPEDVSWLVSSVDTVAFSMFPSVTARTYRKGGAVRIGVPGAAENGATLVYAIDLPSSPVAIDAVLAECNLPTEDPQDALIAALPEDGLPAGLRWRVTARQPHLDRPQHGNGHVIVICVTNARGGLDECRVETEIPRGAGFGEASLDSLRSARVRAVDGQPVGGRRLTLPSFFLVDGVTHTGGSWGSLRRHRTR